MAMTAASSLEKDGPGIQPKALAGLGDACSEQERNGDWRRVWGY